MSRAQRTLCLDGPLLYLEEARRLDAGAAIEEAEWAKARHIAEIASLEVDAERTAEADWAVFTDHTSKSSRKRPKKGRGRKGKSDVAAATSSDGENPYIAQCSKNFHQNSSIQLPGYQAQNLKKPAIRPRPGQPKPSQGKPSR